VKSMNPSNRPDSKLSLRRVMGRVLRRSLSALPVDVRDLFFRITSEQASVRASHQSCLSSVQGALELAKDNGFRPRAIVDVGAYVGNWSRMARQLFPGVPIVMIDGNPENEQALRSAVQSIGSEGKHFIALSTLPFNENAPLFAEVVGFMANAGYAVYDLCGQVRRDSDHALFQMDALFARNDSELRRHKKFGNNIVDRLELRAHT
jgi:hypothetical protein